MTRLEDIGNSLVDARKTQRLTQRELASRLGIHQQQIARWERECYECVSLARLTRVAAALGVDEVVLPGVERQWAQRLPIAAEEQAGYGAATLDAPDAAGVPETIPVRDLGEIIARIREHAEELHEVYGVTHIDVFGSFARGEQRHDSDVDLIVEVAEPTLETVFGSEEYLSRILARKADAGSFASLRPRVQRYASKELVHVWAS